MNQDFIMKLIRYSPVGKFTLNMMKNDALNHFTYHPKYCEKQEKALEKKFRILERNEIGRKLGAKRE